MKRISLFLVTIFSMILFAGNVNAKEVTVNSTMTQEEINTVVNTLSSGDTLNVTAGNYAFKTTDGLTLNEEGRNYHKSVILTTSDVNVVLQGEYTRFELVVRAENTTVILNGNTTLNGEAEETYNTAAAFAVQSGSLTIDTKGYTLYIEDYNNGIRMGYNNTANSITLNIASGSNVDIDTYYSQARVAAEETYYDSYNDHGDAGICGYTSESASSWYCDGAVGSGIYTRGHGTNHVINVNPQATLNIHDSSNSGIYLGYDNSSNKVTINVDNATLNSNNNQSSGIFEDGARSIFQLNATNSTISFSNNKSNGLTGHTTGGTSDHNSFVNINNTTLHIDNNNGIGANNVMFYITNNSYVTGNHDVELGELHGSHGFSNISLMIYDSKLELHGNKYRGLNITTNHEGLPTTINNSVVSVTGSGQSGIYFLNKLGTIVENNSNVTTNGNGITTSTSTFSGDGIVASYNVTFINSYLTSTDPHSIATSETKFSPSTVYIKEYTVAVSEGTGETNEDVVEDKCSSTAECKEYTGTVVITGGSFQASNEVTVENHETYVENREDISPSVNIVNDKNEDLYRFTLHQDINVEVGGEGKKEFTYDYKEEGSLTYKFIYDNTGKAYVWTPISVLNYDSTEGIYNNSTTSLLLSNRFGKDITIYGNSLNLAEKSLASAQRDGYKFLGWFIADNQELATQYAENEEWDKLYALLNTPFDETTKIKLDNVSQEQLTVYAKWAKESKVVVSYITDEGETLHEDITINGYIGDEYVTEEKVFEDYELIKVEGNKTGEFEEETIHVTYIYQFVMGQGGDDLDTPEIPQTGINLEVNKYMSLITLLSLAIIVTLTKKRYNNN